MIHGHELRSRRRKEALTNAAHADTLGNAGIALRIESARRSLRDYLWPSEPPGDVTAPRFAAGWRTRMIVSPWPSCCRFV